MAKAMNKEEFQEALVEVYDNLSKEQFDKLLVNTSKRLKVIASESRDITINAPILKITESNGEIKLESNDTLIQLACDVFLTVKQSRRISFKQFKMLSAFSKTNWFADTTEKEEFKQF
jgi:hypothetical protein